MIFVTVGTTKFPFDRLLKAVDKAMIVLNNKEQLIAQKGISRYKFKYQNCLSFSEIPFNKMIYYLKKARVVMTHGGPATIFLCLRYSKNKPLVLGRSKILKEHTDNHQLWFSQYLQKLKLIITIDKRDNLEEFINNYINKPEQVIKSHQLKPANKLIQKLIVYTDLITG